MPHSPRYPPTPRWLYLSTSYPHGFLPHLTTVLYNGSVSEPFSLLSPPTVSSSLVASNTTATPVTHVCLQPLPPLSATLMTANLMSSLVCLTGLSDLISPKPHSRFPSSKPALPLCSSLISANGRGAHGKRGIRNNSQLEQLGGVPIHQKVLLTPPPKHPWTHPPLSMPTAPTVASTIILYLDSCTSLLIDLLSSPSLPTIHCPLSRQRDLLKTQI